jgi:TfoX/Sxy family transcriptional regulator of competence genes
VEERTSERVFEKLTILGWKMMLKADEDDEKKRRVEGKAFFSVREKRKTYRLSFSSMVS